MNKQTSQHTATAETATDISEAEFKFRLLFFQRIMAFASLSIIAVGIVRFVQNETIIAYLDIAFGSFGLLMLYILQTNKNAFNILSTLILGISFLFFTLLYLLAPENPTRVFLFFLLIACTFFLKSKQAGFYTLWLSIFVLLFFHFTDMFNTGFNNFDILSTTISLTGLYFILYFYDDFKEHQSKSLRILNDSLERKVKARTAELELLNTKLLEEACQLEKLSTTDQLSGLYNRRKLKQLFSYEKKHAKRHHMPLCGILIDIDYFKAVNDTYGHNIGDHVIKSIADILNANTRESDCVGRWGGEEFLILLPRYDIVQAQKLAEKLREIVEHTVMIENHKVTISLGITALIHDESMEGFIHRADMGLYCAKENGRNQVVSLPSIPSQ